MNKEELIEYIESLDLPTEEFYILSSGCLVLYGLRDVAGDLDICVTPKLGKILMERYGIKEGSSNQNNFYHVSDKLEFVINDELVCDKLGKYQVQRLEDMLKYKKARQMKRDLEDVANIERYLAEKK
ncbi:MAG: hypothetical protein IKE01_07085 [Clostridia bacterium]|nr:hypothetical protein [Clostridia bacterium]